MSWLKYPSGAVFSAHGLKGQLYIEFFFSPPEKFWDSLSTLTLSKKGVETQITLESIKPHKKGVLIETPQCQNRDEALAQKGSLVLIHREYFPKDHFVFFWKKKVTTSEGEVLGTIQDICTKGTHVWFQIKPDSTDQTRLQKPQGKNKKMDHSPILLPLKRDWVLEHTDDQVILKLPEGLLEIL